MIEIEYNRRQTDKQIDEIRDILRETVEHVAVAKNDISELQKSISDLTIATTRLADDTHDVVEIYQNIRRTFIVVNAIQSFVLWLLKWSPVAALAYYIKDILKYFGFK